MMEENPYTDIAEHDFGVGNFYLGEPDHIPEGSQGTTIFNLQRINW